MLMTNNQYINTPITNEEQIVHNNWSNLEAEIDKGLKSGISNKSHEDIVADIKRNVRLQDKVKDDK